MYFGDKVVLVIHQCMWMEEVGAYTHIMVSFVFRLLHSLYLKIDIYLVTRKALHVKRLKECTCNVIVYTYNKKLCTNGIIISSHFLENQCPAFFVHVQFPQCDGSIKRSHKQQLKGSDSMKKLHQRVRPVSSLLFIA